MTLREAINKIDNQKPNAFSQDEKIEWLSRLDSTVVREIVETHSKDEDFSFEGYDRDTDLDTELIAPEPYDEIYIRWLEAMIDYTNNEYGRYNNSMMMFRSVYSSFSNWYNRTHLPVKKAFKNY